MKKAGQKDSGRDTENLASGSYISIGGVYGNRGKSNLLEGDRKATISRHQAQ